MLFDLGRVVVVGPEGATDPDDHDASADDWLVGVRRWYLITLFISCFGGGMISLASTYIIYAQTGSLSITGLIVVCTNLPCLVFPGWATRLANRMGGPLLYCLSAVALGLIGFAPAILSAMGDLNSATLLLWYLLGGVIFGLTSPVTGLVRRAIAIPGQVPEFNSAATRSVSIATVAGILLGGALFAAVGPTWIYIIAAIAHFPVAVAVYPVVRRGAGREDRSASGGRFMDSLKVRRAHPGLRAAFYFTTFCFVIGSYSVTFPAIASSIGTNAGILSLLQAAAVFGGLFVVVAVRRVHGHFGWGAVQRVCYLTSGLGILVLAWINHRGSSPTITLIISIVAIVPIGFALNLDASILNALVQVAAPREARTSVLTYYALIPMAFIPIGQEFVGGLSDATSVSTALLVVGALTLLLIEFGPRQKIRPAFDALNDSPDAPSGYPASTHVARPDVVIDHGVADSDGSNIHSGAFSGPEVSDGSYRDAEVGVLEDEVGPIAGQVPGPEMPDRPEAER